MLPRHNASIAPSDELANIVPAQYVMLANRDALDIPPKMYTIETRICPDHTTLTYLIKFVDVPDFLNKAEMEKIVFVEVEHEKRFKYVLSRLNA